MTKTTANPKILVIDSFDRHPISAPAPPSLTLAPLSRVSDELTLLLLSHRIYLSPKPQAGQLSWRGRQGERRSALRGNKDMH